jgi:hypothetical protein
MKTAGRSPGVGTSGDDADSHRLRRLRRTHRAGVSSCCLIGVARNRYSVPYERVGQWVSSRLYPSRIVVIADETLIASHKRLFDRDQVLTGSITSRSSNASRERFALALRLPICRSRCCFSIAALEVTAMVTES